MRIRRISRFRFLLLLAFSVLLFTNFGAQELEVQAAANGTVNFQGKIVSITNGTNLLPGSPSCVVSGAANDTCDFRANLYSDSAGGTLLWREPHSDIEIGQYNGVFSIKLNSVCANWLTPGGSCSGTGIDWGSDDTVYLEIEFSPAGNGVYTEVFSRMLMTSVPHAYYADSAGSVEGGFDSVYSSDTDKILAVNDILGLKFDLTGGGTFEFASGGVSFLTIATDNSVTYAPDNPTDTFLFQSGNLRLGNSNSPGLSLNGNDLFVEGTFEVDSMAAFGNNVDFGNNQALGLRVENNAAAPACVIGMAGKVYFNTTDTNSYVCNGTIWQQLNNAAGGGGSDDLDSVYDNDGNKIMDVDNVAGLKFLSSTAGNVSIDLQSTGDFIVENTGSALFVVSDSGNVGIGTPTPTSLLNLGAGSTTKAPLKFTTGSLLTLPEAGAVEFDGTSLYFTDSAANRQRLVAQSFAEMYQDTPLVAPFIIPVAGTFVQVINFTGGQASGAGYAVTNGLLGNITIGSGGVGYHRVSFALAMTGSNNTYYQAAVFVNGVRQPNIASHTKIATGTDMQNLSGNGIVNLNSGDVVTLRITSQSNGAAVNIQSSNLSISRIGR